MAHLEIKENNRFNIRKKIFRKTERLIDRQTDRQRVDRGIDRQTDSKRQTYQLRDRERTPSEQDLTFLKALQYNLNKK